LLGLRRAAILRNTPASISTLEARTFNSAKAAVMRRSLMIPGLLALATVARAQDPGVSVKDFDQKHAGTEKMHMVAHVVSHPGAWKAADIEIEQDRNRPYVYISGFVNFDAQIYDISNTASPKKIYDWTIENPELHRGIGAMDGKYFKIGNRYY
jgi:hypothetical protein